jgi:hypothetical protein
MATGGVRRIFHVRDSSFLGEARDLRSWKTQQRTLDIAGMKAGESTCAGSSERPHDYGLEVIIAVVPCSDYGSLGACDGEQEAPAR